ncbi:MAG: hypothetical protein IPP37_15625 [Saprospiraceae bacterium]|nr:hypothetical protein [Saprospiraceae bacterium]
MSLINLSQYNMLKVLKELIGNTKFTRKMECKLINMKKLIPFLLITVMVNFSSIAQLDYIHDNVIYKTLYPRDLKEFLISNPNVQLVDVRSPGEYSDTSRYGSLNIGRLRNSINIPIDSIEKQLSKLKSEIEKPIILYCSHSQRSRRVSKILVERGFKNVYNLNGGMSWMNQADLINFPGKKELLENSLPFKSISAEDTRTLIKEKKKLVIIDIRTVSEYKSKDTIESNNFGRIKKSINIPEVDKKIDLAKIKKYRDRDILIYDGNGALSYHVARYLTESGFKKVNTILGGIYSFIGNDKSTSAMRKELLEKTPRYKLLNVKESIDLLNSKKKVKIIDIRSSDEFNNLANRPWKKIGKLKNSVNLQPIEASLKSCEIPKEKDAIIYVYGSDEATLFARCLATKVIKMYIAFLPVFGVLFIHMPIYQDLKVLKA